MGRSARLWVSLGRARNAVSPPGPGGGSPVTPSALWAVVSEPRTQPCLPRGVHGPGLSCSGSRRPRRDPVVLTVCFKLRV